MEIIIVDIDGTLADASHRLPLIQGEHKDWRGFFAASKYDKPIPHICALVHALKGNYRAVFVSGRSDECRGITETWLENQGFYLPHVYMRREGDHRPDHKVKLELLEQVRTDFPGEPIAFALDDRNQVVEMWRANGVPCLQVAEGDF